MLILIAIAFLLKRYGTHAVPLPVLDLPSPSFESPIFVRDDPSGGCQGRTVLDILWSCLATTFACTWVSVHPNVPFKGEGEWTLRFRRVFLMFFSILAPEFMIVWALKQWRGAVMIREAVNEAILEVSTDKEKPVRELWTTTHGHLLQMGGFRLSATALENFFWGGSIDLGRRFKRPPVVNDDHPLFAYISRVRKQVDDGENLGLEESLETKKRILRDLMSETGFYRHEKSSGSWTTEYSPDAELTDDIWEGVLTIDTLKQLLSENLIHLPTITEDEINDRSKGDALSKGIALLQLTWFIVQIITRAAQGLAITELELTTAALAGLNSVMYVFWWNKPRDVRFPVVIRTKGVEELLAKRLPEDVEWSFSEREFDIREHLWACMTTWIKALFIVPGYFAASFLFRLLSILLKSVKTAKAFPRRLTHFFSRIRRLLSRTRKPTTSKNEGKMPLAVDDKPPRKFKNHRKPYALTLLHGVKIATRSAFAPFLCLLYIIDVVLFIPIAKIVKSDYNESLSRDLFDSVGSFNTHTEDEILSTIFYSEDAGVNQLLGTSSIAGALFGALHCLAWHFSFPSHAEQIMWKTASLGIVGSCAVTFQTVLHNYYLADKLHGFWETVAIYLALLSGILCGLASFIYTVARITLLILSITSLRSLPPSAFDTVDWVELVPHI